MTDDETLQTHRWGCDTTQRDGPCSCDFEETPVNPAGIHIRHGDVHDDPDGYCAECSRMDAEAKQGRCTLMPGWTHIAEKDLHYLLEIEMHPKCKRLHLDPATKRRLRHRASKQVDVLGVDHDVGAMVLGILNDIIDDEIDADAERRFANQSIDPDPLRSIAEEQQRQERQDVQQNGLPPLRDT